MKKVAILTWLNNYNYGSILQAYALQKYISKRGYDVTNIDYSPSTLEKLKNWYKEKNSMSLFKEKLDNKLLKLKSKQKDNFKLRNEKFDKFKLENIKTTEKYDTYEKIQTINGKYDIYVCGSDQIWSPKLMNPVFFYSFLPKDSKKIAYAPSFGVSSIDTNKKNKINNYLKTFSSISVREEQGNKILKEMTGKDYFVAVDPTLLITQNDWKKIVSNSYSSEEYILCYFLTPNNEYIKVVKEYAKKKNLKVKIITTVVGPFNTGFEEYVNIGPEEWLDLINCSKYVFTDSFHGSIFSIIFNKKFTIFKRFSDKNKNSQNSRIYNLVNEFELNDRVYNNEDNFDNEINYNNVNKKMTQLSNKSQKWLDEALRGCENE